MCGIVAYTGKKEAGPILIGGLKKLEYRGYDSAGISILNKGNLKVFRALGKISELQKILAKGIPQSTSGIGHTRWATHGEPSEKNSHPHSSTDATISIVHNGIIENYSELKGKLIAEGIKFKSDTDSEVIVHLIAHYYKGSLTDALIKTIPALQGTFGIAVISSREPGIICGTRKGSPLVLGIGDNEHFLGSDLMSFGEHTSKTIFLEDNDIVEISPKSYRILNLSNNDVTRKIEDIEFDADDISKAGFDHYMLKEIFEQTETIKNTFRGRILHESGTARLDGLNLVQKELRGINRIVIIACGTSFYAAMVGEYLIEELSGISVEVEYASEFRYRNPIIDQHTVVFAISQSGETADTLAALEEAKNRGATVLGICNTIGSSIARKTDGGVYLHAGPEIGVASTKAFSSQVTVLTLIALMLGRMRRIPLERGSEICSELKNIPELIAQVLKENNNIKKIAHEYSGASNFLYMGRGFNYPVAMEGALKLKEISYIHAEGYPAAEMKHGPIALIDENMPTVVICPTGPLFDKILSNIQEIKARNGKIIAVTDSDSPKLKELAEHIIPIPKTEHILQPLITVIPLQLLAYHIAVNRGCDVDRPRNLAKSVTVE